MSNLLSIAEVNPCERNPYLSISSEQFCWSLILFALQYLAYSVFLEFKECLVLNCSWLDVTLIYCLFMSDYGSAIYIVSLLFRLITSQNTSAMLFVWDDWEHFCVLRRTAFMLHIESSYAQSKVTTSSIQNVDPFITIWKKKYRREQKRKQRPYHLPFVM